MSCCRLDWQRPEGEEVDHPDEVEQLRRQVNNLQLCLSRLNGRPVEERDTFCGQEVDKVERAINVAQDCLRLRLLQRARESETDADRQLDQAELNRLNRLMAEINRVRE